MKNDVLWLGLWVVSWVSVGVEAGEGLRVTTDFAGGTAEILSVDPKTATIHIQPAVQWEKGFPCWWYLRVDGLNRGEQLTFKISANPRPFRGNEVLNRSWSQPRRLAISTDNVTWGQIENRYDLQENGTAIYEFAAPSEQIWLAWGPPYGLSHAETLLANVERECASAQRFTLATSRGGRRVSGIRIGGGSEEKSAKYGVWIQARQHAWEVGSSWVAQGFLKWAARDHPDAKALRSMSTIWLVPIVDVDRVAIGAGGKDSIPHDHNRDWSDNPFYPAVAAAQSRLAELHAAGQLDFFLDIHNPGDDKLLHYFYGPNDWEELPQVSKRNYTLWLQLCKGAIVEPLALEPEYKFVTWWRKSKDEINRVSSNWVHAHTAPHVISTTFEAASNTPQSTQEGYQIAGSQLAQALTQYLREDPRRD